MTGYNALNTKDVTLHLTTEIKQKLTKLMNNLSRQTLKKKKKLQNESEGKRFTHVSTLFIFDKT